MRISDWSSDVCSSDLNRAEFTVFNAFNTSLIASQNPVQTAFYGGGSRYAQNVANLNISREVPHILSGANLALGIEHRYENYKLVSGESNSYTGAGAQGLPGYHPPSPVDESR